MLSGVLIAESGQPFTIFAGPVAGELNQRVNLNAPLTTTGNPTNYIGNVFRNCLARAQLRKPVRRPVAVCAAIDRRHSRRHVSVLRAWATQAEISSPAPATWTTIWRYRRCSSFTRRLSLSLRAESYNLFNHPNYYNPISAYSLDGITQYSQFGQIKSAHNARQFQFGVRLSW